MWKSQLKIRTVKSVRWIFNRHFISEIWKLNPRNTTRWWWQVLTSGHPSSFRASGGDDGVRNY